MPIPITVPRLGWTMEEGVFEGWLKQEGEFVPAGAALFSLEGEKATQDVEAVDSGVLRIPPDAPTPGTVVPVGAVLGYLLAPNETPPWESGPPNNERSGAQHAPAAGAMPEAPIHVHIKPAAKSIGAVVTQATPKISPRARRVSRELGVDWSQIQGTGTGGRIRERDVRAAHSTSSPPVQTTKTGADRGAGGYSPRRSTIAARMRAAVETTAPVTLTTECDVTTIVQWRSELLRPAPQPHSGPDSNRTTGDSNQAVVPSYTDVIVHLTAGALAQHPIMMGQWTEQGILIPHGIHINLAIHSDAGLVAPVIRDVNTLSLHELAATVRSLVELANSRRLTAEQLVPGNFTISNLGMYGVDAFTPIVNLPQSAILGVGRIRRVPAVFQDQIMPRDMMVLSLTFDHRVMDGVPAAKFLATLRQLLESARFVANDAAL